MSEINVPKLTGEVWFNSEPVDIYKHDGVFLIDFWTYTCVNCLRTVPSLQKWYKIYKDLGLTIIGIHTPEFGFEKDRENVHAALERLGVKWPVVLDNDKTLWDAFANKYWPQKYLVNHQKKIVYTHIGEGGYPETEEAIQKTLLSWKPDIQLPPLPEKEAMDIGKVCIPTTPELYCGSFRGRFGNLDVKSGLHFYENAPIDHKNLIYLSGSWELTDEFLQYGSDKMSPNDFLTLPYNAKEVNAVFNMRNKPYEVNVQQDGQYLTPENKGKDVLIDEQTGRSFFQVTQPRMYRLVENPQHKPYLLKLSPSSQEFQVFAFTFGGSC